MHLSPQVTWAADRSKAVVPCLLIRCLLLSSLLGFCVYYMLCCAVLCVLSALFAKKRKKCDIFRKLLPVTCQYIYNDSSWLNCIKLYGKCNWYLKGKQRLMVEVCRWQRRFYITNMTLSQMLRSNVLKFSFMACDSKGSHL